MERRRLTVVQAQLDDRNVRFGKHVLQHDPGPMIESPLRVGANWKRACEIALKFLRKIDITWSRIHNLVHFLGEAIEIVVHPGLAACCDECATASEPVSGYRKD